MVGIVGYNFCIIEAVVDHVTSYFGFFSSLKFFSYSLLYYLLFIVGVFNNVFLENVY